MSQLQINYYEKLVYQLVNSPTNEEINVLANHLNLIDNELLKTMESIINQLGNKGNFQGAYCLINLVDVIQVYLGLKQGFEYDAGNKIDHNELEKHLKNVYYYGQEQRKKAQLNVINELLNCPNGQEGKILRENDLLLDGSFVKLMIDVAQELIKQGQHQAYQFLFSIATPLSSQLSERNRKPYFDLIHQLLSCSQGEERKILNDHPDLINSFLVDTMREVANSFDHQAEANHATFLRQLSEQISRELENDSPYLKLVHDLMNCANGEDKKIIEAHPELINTQLIETINSVVSSSQYLSQNLKQWLNQLKYQLKVTDQSWHQDILTLDTFLNYSSSETFQWMINQLAQKHSLKSFQQEIEFINNDLLEDEIFQAAEYKRQGKFEQAFQIYSELFQKTPTYPNLYLSIYKVLAPALKLQQAERAMEIYTLLVAFQNALSGAAMDLSGINLFEWKEEDFCKILIFWISQDFNLLKHLGAIQLLCDTYLKGSIIQGFGDKEAQVYLATIQGTLTNTNYSMEDYPEEMLLMSAAFYKAYHLPWQSLTQVQKNNPFSQWLIEVSSKFKQEIINLKETNND